MYAISFCTEQRTVAIIQRSTKAWILIHSHIPLGIKVDGKQWFAEDEPCFDDTTCPDCADDAASSANTDRPPGYKADRSVPGRTNLTKDAFWWGDTFSPFHSFKKSLCIYTNRQKFGHIFSCNHFSLSFLLSTLWINIEDIKYNISKDGQLINC